MDQPLVSVILLCYNHEAYVSAAIASVEKQRYPNIQLVIVDDASHDNSVAVIQEHIKNKPQIIFLPLTVNNGNCKAFNKGLALATGDFIIDLSADDVMRADRVQKQVDFFSSAPADYGVVFTDAEYIDERGSFIKNHFEDLFKKKLLTAIPEGDVYEDVLYTYFIASPTMMVKRVVFDHLNGYDETLAYEDFDFWVRSSRNYRYGFINEKLTQIRRLKNSMSSGWYKQGDRQLHSTYLVCEKAIALNRTERERTALLKRVRYELRQAVFSNNRYEAGLFYGMLANLTTIRFIDTAIYTLSKLHLPLAFFRSVYHKLFF